MEALQAELQQCRVTKRKDEIVSELRCLRREQDSLSMKKGGETRVASLPQSHVDKLRAERAATARISGRDQIKAHFVQGGAPGSGGAPQVMSFGSWSSLPARVSQWADSMRER